MSKHIIYKPCSCGGKMQLWHSNKTGDFWWCYSYCGKQEPKK